MEKRGKTIKSNLIDILLNLSSLGIRVLEDEPLKNHCSFRIGGKAKLFIEVLNEDALREIFKVIKEFKIKIFVLGGGTNILFSDEGYDGIILKLTGDFENIEVDGNKIICGAGAKVPKVLSVACESSLSGLQCISGIPGTIGAAVFGNVGTAKTWIGNFVESLEVFDIHTGKKELLNKKDVKFEYRSTNLEGKIISKVLFLLEKGSKDNIEKEISESIKKRKDSQPLNFANAGCIFKNPKNFGAGQLIDEAGLKGVSIGDAQVSSKHANFIVNVKNAKSKDVLKLMNIIRQEVKNKFNVDLEPEIKVIK